MAKFIYTCFACGFPIAFEESERPDRCPGCGAPASQFLVEPWCGSIENRRIHVDPPKPPANRDPYHIAYHIMQDYAPLQGVGRIRRWIMGYDNAEESIKYYEDIFGWDIVKVPGGDPEKPIYYCATCPGTEDWEPKFPSQEYGYLIPKDMGLPTHSWVFEVRDLEKTCEKIVSLGGKVLKEHFLFDNQDYCVVEDTEGNAFYLWEIKDRTAPKTGFVPDRPPKKFTKKSLHGRTRYVFTFYQDLKRLMTFYYELFGFDWIEGPQAFSGLPEGSEKPVLIIGTGPTQPDGEGSVPGHMNFNPAPGGRECDVTGLFTEIDMERDLDEMLDEMVAHGGKILTDSSKNFYAKEPIHGESWEVTAVMVDPAGNYFYLWKCPSSRTWEEPETGWDQ